MKVNEKLSSLPLQPFDPARSIGAEISSESEANEACGEASVDKANIATTTMKEVMI